MQLNKKRHAKTENMIQDTRGRIHLKERNIKRKTGVAIESQIQLYNCI